MKSGSVKVVVPARLGSNRIKIKSLRLLNKKPLIQYILSALRETKHLNDVYVNSDSDLFAKIAERMQVKFYKRKPELATSASLIDDYIYDFMVNERSDYLAVVNPTSPFISPRELDEAWYYFATNDYDTLLSCERIQTHCFFKGQAINFLTGDKHPRSQDLEPVLALNFAITIWDCKKFIMNYEANKHGVYTGNLGFFQTEGYSNIDIDYEEDFLLAEFVARFLDSDNKLEAEYADIAQDIIKNNVNTYN